MRFSPQSKLGFWLSPLWSKPKAGYSPILNHKPQAPVGPNSEPQTLPGACLILRYNVLSKKGKTLTYFEASAYYPQTLPGACFILRYNMLSKKGKTLAHFEASACYIHICVCPSLSFSPCSCRRSFSMGFETVFSKPLSCRLFHGSLFNKGQSDNWTSQRLEICISQHCHKLSKRLPEGLWSLSVI